MAEEVKKTAAKSAPKKAPAKAAAPKAAAEKKPAAKKPVEKPVEEKAEPVKAEAPAKKAPAKKAKPAYVNRVVTKYQEEVVPALIKEFGYTSPMQAPRLEKIVVNIGLDDSVAELAQISGQKPVITKAKKSIAGFKLREGQAIGCKVTLRGVRMYEFYDKLVSIALPRVRDFRGISRNAFDGRGNYTLGVKEQLIFPEIDYDKVSKIRGMDIVIVTTANTDAEALSLLEKLGMPFKR